MAYPDFPQDQGRYPEQSQATTILVLGIVAIVVQVLGPVAWALGNRELAAIDRGLRPPDDRASANAGRILGIISTGLLVVGIIALVLLLSLFSGVGFF